jgi:uncharacterized lipoprotein YmbA
MKTLTIVLMTLVLAGCYSAAPDHEYYEPKPYESPQAP